MAVSVSVCVCVCLSAIISPELGPTRPMFTIFAPVTYGRGSVLLWRRSDTLRISGFMDDAIFAYKLRLRYAVLGIVCGVAGCELARRGLRRGRVCSGC